MKYSSTSNKAFTLAELMVATGVFSAASIIIYLLLYNGTLLAAWNTSSNVAHEQARTAMLQMIQDLHSAVSLPALADANGNPLPTPSPAPSPGASASPAPGIAFQLWSMGPFRIAADAATGQNVVQVTIPNGTQAPIQPTAGQRLQRLIVRTHQLEDDITDVTPANLGTGGGTVSLTLANNVPVAIQGTTSRHIVCFITDRCSYAINNGALDWRGPTNRKAFAIMGNNMTNPTPFTTRTTAAGAPYYQFVAAFDLSTAYAKTTNRHFVSANILLRSEVPMRARLTDQQ